MEGTSESSDSEMCSISDSDIRRKSLEVVNQQMRSLTNAPNETSKLIKHLINEKRKFLKLTEGTFSSEEEGDSEKIMELLEKERKVVFETETNIELEESVIQEKKLPPKIIFPVIPKHKINEMLSMLRTKKCLSAQEKKLQLCLAHFTSPVKRPFKVASVIIKAINDSLLKRNWKNLTKLLLMLIHSSSFKQRPVVRHMGLILDKYHPAMQCHGLQNQFHMITTASKIMKTGHTALI